MIRVSHIGFALGLMGIAMYVITAMSDDQAETEDHRIETFEITLWNGDWNNMLAGLLRSNRTDLLREMLTQRVAYEIADLWRYRTNATIPEHTREQAEELLRDARPTVLEATQSTNFLKMPIVYRTALLEFLRSTNGQSRPNQSVEATQPRPEVSDDQ